jgi:hypothetical protein
MINGQRTSIGDKFSIKIKQVKVLRLNINTTTMQCSIHHHAKEKTPRIANYFSSTKNPIQSNPIQSNLPYPIFQHDLNMESRLWSKSQLNAMLMNIVAIYVYIVHTTTITTTTIV